MEPISMNALTDRLYAAGVVPVVTVDDPKRAVRLAEVLMDAGLPVMEITFRTEACAEAIRLVAHHHPGMLVGAGTVLRGDHVDAARHAGASFCVSPGLTERIVARAEHLRMPLIPGVATPSEVQRAVEQGFELLKFFPAGGLGGAATLKALAGPFRDARFIPTGGVDLGNMGAYLAQPSVVACGGSWMVPPALVREGKFRQIRSLVAETMAVVASARAAVAEGADAEGGADDAAGSASVAGADSASSSGAGGVRTDDDRAHEDVRAVVSSTNWHVSADANRSEDAGVIDGLDGSNGFGGVRDASGSGIASSYAGAESDGGANAGRGSANGTGGAGGASESYGAVISGRFGDASADDAGACGAGGAGGAGGGIANVANGSSTHAGADGAD